MEDIIKPLSSRKEVLFAFLFGSAARGEASSLSDVDIGVFLDPSLSEEDMLEVLMEIASQLKVGIKGDLVLLNKASPSLAFEVIRGRALVVRDERALKEFVHRTLKIYHDRRHYDLRWARRILSR
ncbi:MAG: nucleotidyltransferase domain-containing protein [Thermoproteota archaeon]|nr:MAG: nucleotidyltransferase domain-containing protein [Candidatus Korarchaeota archaeon]